jgi:hypothetical protein
MAQNVVGNLSLQVGFFHFHDVARVASFLVVSMAATTGIVLPAGLPITGFLGGYMVVYVTGAALYLAYVARGPLRIAAPRRSDLLPCSPARGRGCTAKGASL